MRQQPVLQPAADTADILTSLDPDQRRAAESTGGALMIVAGPGSGKTRTLTHRIAHLVTEHGVPAANCLAITFTRRAAAEMRERLATLLPTGTAQAPVHTFHSLGLAILREHGAVAGLNRGFRIANDADKIAIFANMRGFPESKVDGALRTIAKVKRTGVAPDDEAGETLAAYQQGLMLRNLIDFEDLIDLTVRLLEKHPKIASLLHDHFRSVSVDEFQDIDEQQYRFIRLIAPEGANLCVIGDPDQAIYSFRGADASSFTRFRQDYPRVREIHLRRNYRSSGTIVTAAGQMIAGSRDRSIAEVVREMQERITIHAAPTDKAEAEYVIQTIEELVGGHNFFSIDSGRADGRDGGLTFADFAVLYRTDAQSSAIIEAFVRSGIPFKKHSHARLSDDPTTHALLLELYDQPCDGPLPPRLRAAAQRLEGSRAAPDAAALEIALRRLTEIAESCARDGKRFADAVAVASEADFFDPRAARVSLLTLHAAKGLEFPVVFVVGLEDGILPLYWGKTDGSTLAEERRLFYVGMTRAMDQLYISRAQRRFWRGRVQELSPSPFLQDIEAEFLRHQRPSPRPARAEDRQLKLL